ncbi:transposase [Piscirickettsia salmonis]|uniref:transposase n=1 Tax=Piscirickettsia salmonis TaxID=1238 RepID=UPI0018AD0187|nr:transposase [Piscirickettsia salmonis]
MEKKQQSNGSKSKTPLSHSANGNTSHLLCLEPRKFWAFFLFNRELLNIIFRTAANTLLETAKKKGLIIGIFAALHTFGRDLKWNVHVHISVTRGGYDEANDSWCEIYFTRKVIMPMWRYAVTNLLRQTYSAQRTVSDIDFIT